MEDDRGSVKRYAQTMSLHVVTWNVNSLRSCLGKGFSAWLTAANPDVVCLQEVRAELKHLTPLEPLFPGYRCFWNPAERPGYAGTAILTKFEPRRITIGLASDSDPQGRAITADYGSFRVFSLYAPNASPLTEKIPIKLHWLDRLHDHLQRYQDTPLIVAGDLNVALTKWDSRGKQHPLGINGCTPEERAGLETVMTRCALVDPMREQHPEQVLSTWWHAVNAERHPLDGVRFDYLLLRQADRSRVTAQAIHAQVFGSDHCPVSLTLDLPTTGLSLVQATGQVSLL